MISMISLNCTGWATKFFRCFNYLSLRNHKPEKFLLGLIFAMYFNRKNHISIKKIVYE